MPATLAEVFQNEAAVKALTPAGYKLLVLVNEAEKKTKSGIYMPDDLAEKERVATIVGRVVAMGPDAYGDKKKFPSGPWCRVNDWIIFRSYAGTRVNSCDAEYRLLNDDSVEAVTTTPEDVQRPT